MTEELIPFRAEESAIIRFGDAGVAPVLSYDVPQPAEYNGRYFLQLEFDDEIWSPAAKPKPPRPPGSGGSGEPRNPPTTKPQSTKLNADLAAANVLVSDMVKRVPKTIPSATSTPTEQSVTRKKLSTPDPADGRRKPAHVARVDEMVDRLGEDQVIAQVSQGAVIVERRTLDNQIHYELKDPPDPAVMRPRIAIVHVCRMSSYLGTYGAGRTISTFSLLPGEKHEIEIKTYKRTKQTTTEASSILDSFESTTADEFQSDLSSENTTQNSEEKNFAYHAEAEASATWGWGSAKASGGVEGGKSSKREEFAKNVSSTTQKHAASAASKRQVEVNTSSQTETEQGEEFATKRTIENINVGRTLNFVFRQMNQVFVTVLSIIDVRVAFTNGEPGQEREYTLPEIDELLNEKINSASRQAVMDAIWQSLFVSFDWRGNHRPLIEAVKLEAAAGGQAMKMSVVSDHKGATFWRFKQQATTLDSLQDGATVTVPGVVLGVTKSTLPTDGVIVDALLGQGNALDAYSMGLQMEAVSDKKAQNDRASAETELLQAKLQVIRDKDKERAEIITMLFPTLSQDGNDKAS
jgi:hypothetical protein